MSSNTPISRCIKSYESKGKAIPISQIEEENLLGYTNSRLFMMVTAIEYSEIPTSSPASRVSRKFLQSIELQGKYAKTALYGSNGVDALTGTNSWNKFLKDNKGVFKGKGWQRRAAEAYYNSNYYLNK
jgi:hypothetical protein